jgi:hypothetical protein
MRIGAEQKVVDASAEDILLNIIAFPGMWIQ